MNRFTLIVTIVLLASTVTAQDLVSLDELQFSSTFEKDVVTDHFKNHKSDFFNLFIASGSALNESAIQKARLRFSDQLTELKKTATYKRRDKNLKFIYTSIHDAFLKKYEEQN